MTLSVVSNNRFVFLFDRDGTLIENKLGLSDASLVILRPGAREALTMAREHGFRLGIVTNQAAVGRGDVTQDQLSNVHDRIEELLGPFDVWKICIHTPSDRCSCRKPEPGLILDAAKELNVAPIDCIVLGDHMTDMEAASRAGALGVLVPSADTSSEEVRAAGRVVHSLIAAVQYVIHSHTIYDVRGNSYPESTEHLANRM